MEATALWRRYREQLFDDRELGLRLDPSRMGIDAEGWASYAERMQPAFSAMRELEAGAIANPDEQRRVGHYWLRAPELAPDAEIRRQIEEALDAVERFVAGVHSGRVVAPAGGRFEHLLLIGIGGSALGPQFVWDALGTVDAPLDCHFFDNTDPDGFARTLARLEGRLGKTLSIVISKSGGTPETRNGMLEARAAYQAAGVDFGKAAVAITQQGSKLDAFAVEHGFLARFPMWDWVGGRTSETSAVGLLPAALHGTDIRSLLAGAAAIDRSTRIERLAANPAAILAAAWHHASDGRGAKDMVVLPYRDRLLLFSRYLQQLVMESLGKEKNLAGEIVHQGLAVYGNKGSTDQHAYVQQLRDGIANFFVTFVEVLEDPDPAEALEVEPGVTSGDFLHGFLRGTRAALHDNGRASLTLTVDRIDARTIGMLIALYERAVGLYASLIGVNAYHQPGVEAGKRAAAEVLELQRRVVDALESEGATCETIAERIGSEDVESVFHILERLATLEGRGVGREPGATPFDARYRAL